MQELINKKAFKEKNIYIGIDVHKLSWKVTIMLDEITHKTFSQDPNAMILAEYLRRNFPGGTYLSAYEAGFCGFSVHRALLNEGINNIVVNPADIPVTDKEKRQKEDKRDSRKIARGLRNSELVAIHVPSVETEELRFFLKDRMSLTKDLTRMKNRIKSYLNLFGIEVPAQFKETSKHFSKRYINWLRDIQLATHQGNLALANLINRTEFLRKELLSINREIKRLAKEEKFLKQIGLLTRIPGIGTLTALIIIAIVEDINRFKRSDDFFSFVGLVPSTNRTGDNEKTGDITPRRNKILRGIIVESSWIAVRYDPALMLAFTDLCKRMEKSKAIIRIAKKLLNRIRYVLKEQKEYAYNVAA